MDFSNGKLGEFYPLIIDFLIGTGKLLGFILFAFITLKIILYLFEKLLKGINPDKMIDKLNESEAFGKKKIEVDLTKICLPIVKWFVILLFIIIGSELLQLEMVSAGISSVISILPKVFSAVLIFIIGVYLASLARNAVRSVMSSLGGAISNIVSTVLFYVIIIFVSVAALEQIGVNTVIVTSNITLIFGSILVTFTLSFGLGSKDIVSKILLSFYAKKTLAVGDRIEVQGVMGVIQSIDNLFVVVRTEKESIAYPIKTISEKKIKIFSK